MKPARLTIEDLRQIDIITREVGRHIESGRILLKDDKLRVNFEMIEPNQSWIHTRFALDRECARWHNTYFEYYGIIPRHCFNCWKVVVRPKNLEQLYELHELMEKLQLPSKCGVDRRPQSHHKGIYVGFFYGPMAEGFEGGKKLFNFVKNKVRGALSLDVPVILKRGCTEFEDKYGPSNKWVYNPAQHFLEDLLDSTWVVESNKHLQPTVARMHTQAIWINYAFSVYGDKDPTIKKFIRNYPQSMGVVPTATYHDIVPKIEMEVVEKDGRKFQGLAEDERRSHGSRHRLQETAVGTGPGAGRSVGLGSEKVGNLEIPWTEEESQEAEGSSSPTHNDSPDKGQEVSGAGS